MALLSKKLGRSHAIVFYIFLGGISAVLISRYGFVKGLSISVPLSVVAALLMRLVFGRVE